MGSLRLVLQGKACVAPVALGVTGRFQDPVR